MRVEFFENWRAVKLLSENCLILLVSTFPFFYIESLLQVFMRVKTLRIPLWEHFYINSSWVKRMSYPWYVKLRVTSLIPLDLSNFLPWRKKRPLAAHKSEARALCDKFSRRVFQKIYYFSLPDRWRPKDLCWAQKRSKISLFWSILVKNPFYTSSF